MPDNNIFNETRSSDYPPSSKDGEQKENGDAADKNKDDGAGTAKNNNEEGKKNDANADTADISNHPEFVKLRQKNDELSGNLKNQGDIIAKKNERIKELMSKTGIDESELPYKPSDIKFSKDLTAEERDEMTDGEIKAMDDAAKAKQKANDIRREELKRIALAEIEAETAEATAQEGKETKLDANQRKSVVDTEIGRLAGQDKERERELREAVKMLDLSGLNEEETKKRIAYAERLLPNWTPPKENGTAGANAKTVDGGGGKPKEEALAEQIIKESSHRNDGTYSL